MFPLNLKTILRIVLLVHEQVRSHGRLWLTELETVDLKIIRPEKIFIYQALRIENFHRQGFLEVFSMFHMQILFTKGLVLIERLSKCMQRSTGGTAGL